MIVRSTTGGPIFVFPDKLSGNVRGVLTQERNSMVYTPPRWFMIYEIYAAQCPFAWHLKIRCANFFDHKKTQKKKNPFLIKKYVFWAPGALGTRDRLLVKEPFSSKIAIGFVSATYSKKKSSLYQIFD